jgi:hypothetical protein
VSILHITKEADEIDDLGSSCYTASPRTDFRVTVNLISVKKQKVAQNMSWWSRLLQCFIPNVAIKGAQVVLAGC